MFTSITESHTSGGIMPKDVLLEMIERTRDPETRKYIQYHEDTIAYLEYMNYLDYVIEYDPMNVAIFLAISIELGYTLQQSYHRVALTIFSVAVQRMAELNTNTTRH